ncbi:hypothetical protein NE237_006364 [Protea cynaroides]|uniref:B box-type domain-containing protein n=1 Tax=Protea cynaroides TaxID=273540 RepID=A0A9Q0KMG7_9MAGN|nr:hypothetical protein NE237_006364 [Protea cynaroides]
MVGHEKGMANAGDNMPSTLGSGSSWPRDHSINGGVPPWLKLICDSEFFEPCNTHSNLKKNDLNFFCIDCLCSMCTHCLQLHHEEHQHIQIRKYMYRDVINVNDLRKLFSCSGIQVSTICGENKAAMMFDEDGESIEEIAKEKEKEDITSQPKKEGPNSRKRKGIPVRAPQF